jgi:hypothetical protein
MVAVNAYFCTMPDGTRELRDTTYPVVALRCTLYAEFDRDDDDAHAPPATVAAAEADGWRHCRTGEDVQPLIYCHEFGVVEWSVYGSADFEVSDVFACPWPPEEDGERLAAAVRELRNNAVEKWCASREAERARGPAQAERN